MLNQTQMSALTCVFLLGLFACGDDSSGGSKTTQDTGTTTDSSMANGQTDGGQQNDAAVTVPDVGMLEVDATLEDAAPSDSAMVLPDAMVDAALIAPDADPIVMGGMECMESADCGDFERCLSNVCQLDLLPEVFVIDTVEVTEPANTAGLLQGVLQGIIGANQLNLIVEPGGYQENGDYRWYVGNGGLRDDATYVYLGQYPIQNFDGFWREKADGSTYWAMEGDTPFVLNVPAGQIETNDGPVTCMTAFNATVDVTITPTIDNAGNPRMNMTLSGYLLETDIRTVSFRLNGVELSLSELLDPMDLNIDTDGDGVPDAYPFDFSGTAAAVNFVGDPPAADGSNRNPDAVIENPPECDE